MRMHLSSSRSMLYRFFILYGSLYAGFGVQSPYLSLVRCCRIDSGVFL